MIDECKLKHDAFGYDFANYIDGYINGFEENQNTYFISTPDTLLMFHHAICHPHTKEPREYWHVHYMATRRKNKLDALFKWMPYYLPEVGIARPFKNTKGLIFYKTDRISKLCKTFSTGS